MEGGLVFFRAVATGRSPMLLGLDPHPTLSPASLIGTSVLEKRTHGGRELGRRRKEGKYLLIFQYTVTVHVLVLGSTLDTRSYSSMEV